jgi:hypothetical protein
MAGKRIYFTTATANDQGGVIPNEVIDFTRFNANPVVLKEHVWNSDPIGLWTDIKLDSKGYSGIPVFHKLTEASKETAALYEGGWLRACSIGGEAIWRVNNAGQLALDKNGNKICEKFYLYEISIVTLPSNEDATQVEPVALAAHIYDNSEVENITRTILSSKYSITNNKQTMAEEVTPVAPENTEVTANTTTLAADAKGTGLPQWFKDIIGLGGNISFGSKKETFDVAAPAPKGEPESTQPKKADVGQPNEQEIKLKAKAEKAKKLEEAKAKAEMAVKACEEAKAKAEAEDASAKDKEAYEACKMEAEDAIKSCDKLEAEEADSIEEEKDGKTKNSAAVKPVLLSSDELKSKFKMATTPTVRSAVEAKVKSYNGKTFTQLMASSNEQDKSLIEKARSGAAHNEISEYAAVLSSIMSDPKLKPLVEKTRVLNTTMAQLQDVKTNVNGRQGGATLHTIMSELQKGEVSVLGANGEMTSRTTLNSTDNALASPALTTIEWLSLAIFNLFPTTSWKNDIPMFGATYTGSNTGLIWANIAADPTVYKGTKPTGEPVYTYTDNAVSLALTPYFLQPMQWNPYYMHQLRYDQMGTGWAQAFMKLNTVIDDTLLYTLASTVPSGSIVATSGISGYQTLPQTVQIGGSASYNKFYYNPSYTGSLVAPVLNDIVNIEQLYASQNFALENEKATLVADPIMIASLNKDPETKSLLTRWVNANGGGTFTKFKNTILNERSRTIIVNPAAGNAVIDPTASIPSTAISAGLAFIPSQVGIGIGMLDVFMVQDPVNYGYTMSADIRMGIVPLRANFNGTAILNYGQPNV